MMTTQYLDGLGRPLQTVTWQGSHDGKDMVQAMTYDEFGRIVYQYLPYASTVADGAFKQEPFGKQKDFYGGATGVTAHFPNEDIFYSITEYDNSPLNRITKQMAPGNSWAGSSEGISSTWASNTTADDVRKWTVGTTGDPTAPGTFGAGELSIAQTTNEEGNIVKQYTDKLGRVVLKKVQKGSGSGRAIPTG